MSLSFAIQVRVLPSSWQNILASSVINAGDGAHEHPSQALLDMMTVMEHKGKIAGLKLAIIGDIAHSRVAVSDIIGFSQNGSGGLSCRSADLHAGRYLSVWGQDL